MDKIEKMRQEIERRKMEWDSLHKSVYGLYQLSEKDYWRINHKSKYGYGYINNESRWIDMIDVQNIMIGDLLQNTNGNTGKVVGIRNYAGTDPTLQGAYEVVMQYHENSLCYSSPKLLAPIPITQDILEKNGFINDFYEDEGVADYIRVRNEGYSLRCKANGWDDALVTWCNGSVNVVTDFNGEVRRDMDYVHELQHAFRLCGIEKEIVL